MTLIKFIASVPTLGLLVLSGVCAAQTPNLEAPGVPRFAPETVLVKFKPGTTASAVSNAHRQADGQVMKTIPGIDVQVVRVPAGSVPAKVAAYGNNPNVEYAEPDYYRVLRIPSEEPGPTPAGADNFFEEQWYLNNTGQTHMYVAQSCHPLFGCTTSLESTQGTNDADIDAPEGWDLSIGFATTDNTAYNTPKIAVLDTGADCNTLELSGKCLEITNVVGTHPYDPDDNDNLGHGTFTASEAAAQTDNNEGIAGAGWDTSIGVFKVCYRELVTDGVNFFFVGLCPVSASAEGISLAATDQVDENGLLLRSQYHVITMSYGGDEIDPDSGEITPSGPSSAECDAIDLARSNGVVVVAAAGNNGDTNKIYPAACTDETGESTALAVAASDHNDDRAAFSTYSNDDDDWVSIAAPGQAIIGVLPDAACGIASGSDTCIDWWDGTSMAAPLVAGTAALVWAELYKTVGNVAPAGCVVNGVLCNREVRDRIESGADATGAQGQDLLAWTRHGRLNLAAALGATEAPEHWLTITKSGDGEGAVMSSDGGIDCGSDCTEVYLSDATVALTAEPANGSTFSVWGGNCSGFGTDSSIEVMVDADMTCDAGFTANPDEDMPPVASFTYSCEATACQFDGSNSSGGAGGLESYAWEFGDGEVGSGTVVDHFYAAEDTYTVSLTVSDTKGFDDTTSASIQVKKRGKSSGSSSDDGGDGGKCPPGKASKGEC